MNRRPPPRRRSRRGATASSPSVAPQPLAAASLASRSTGRPRHPSSRGRAPKRRANGPRACAASASQRRQGPRCAAAPLRRAPADASTRDRPGSVPAAPSPRERRPACRRCAGAERGRATSPTTVSARVSAGARTMSPPTMRVAWRAARAPPSRDSSRRPMARVAAGDRPRATVASTGRAPIAAMSERLDARAR